MQVFDAATTRAALPIRELLDAVEEAYRAVSSGRDHSPLRSGVPFAGGDLLLMPGVSDGAPGATVKVVTVIPQNAERGLPTVQSVVLVFDAATGAPRAVLDGATITAMRTGAASGVATRLLARPDAEVLGLIGAGAQAAWQVRAVMATRPIREVRVFARSSERCAAFVATLADELGPATRVVAVASAREAVRAADVVCCATTSSQPVFDAAWIRPGTHVNGIGAFQLGMVELPPALFGRASLVAVDATVAVLAEAGDLVAALEAGEIGAADLVEIGTVQRDWVKRRDPSAITVFKSVGLAAQDVAAASVAMRNLASPDGA